LWLEGVASDDEEADGVSVGLGTLLFFMSFASLKFVEELLRFEGRFLGWDGVFVGRDEGDSAFVGRDEGDEGEEGDSFGWT
jgi:hypothetical protein